MSSRGPVTFARIIFPPMSHPRRCYSCDELEAAYEAHLAHDSTPVVLLCEACARWERAGDSVVWIRRRRDPVSS